MLERIGKYKVNGLIAKGASSRVYLAQDPNLSIQVAIKIFDGKTDAAQRQPNNTKGSLSDFLTESKILHQLSSSPHIISFMEFDFTEAKQAYIVMPFVKRSMADLLGEDNKLSPHKTLQIVQQILIGLTHIHEAGLVHLDIKPANILIDDNEQIQISDFGISMKTRAPTSQQRERIQSGGLGSLHYASPEQLNSVAEATVQSDLFAVGAIMYRCLTGVNYDSNASEDIKMDARIQDALHTLLLRALSLVPEERPASAAHFLNEVNELLSSLNTHGDEYDPDATRVWRSDANSVQRNAAEPDNNDLDDLNKSVLATLLKEGEVNSFHFERFALLAKAQLHERYSDEWLQQYIAQTQTHLSKTNSEAAAFFLWVAKVNQVIAQHGNSDIDITRDIGRLIELGKVTLHMSEQQISAILDTKLASQVNLSLSDRANRHRFNWRLMVLFTILTVGMAIVWWVYQPEQADVADAAPLISAKSASTLSIPSSSIPAASIPASSASTSDTLQVIQTSAAIAANAVTGSALKLILRVQPQDADVVLQSSEGIAVAHDQVTPGEYWLRVSKNGYTTKSQKINITGPEYIVDERLKLSDSRYFIGATERTVADGIPLEFILLPERLHTSTSSQQGKKESRVRMMSFEVTNELYQACVYDGKCSTSTKLSTDARYKTFALPQHPVINVSWFDITEQFIPWLSAKTNSQLRLPTKEEWEYAGAATTSANEQAQKKYSWGADIQYGKAHCKNCNVSETSINTTMPVKSFPANAWQLFDMHGNVQEWTESCARPNALVSSASIVPRCDVAMVKGGSWLSKARDITIMSDDYLKKTTRSHTTGFRLVEVVDE